VWPLRSKGGTGPIFGRGRPAGRRHRAGGAALGAAAAVAAGLLAATGTFERLELKALDLLFLLRGPHVPSPQIIIVGVDYESLQALGSSWPWPREYHARLLDRLREARVVGLDFLFTQPSDPRQDRLLAEAARFAGNVVWASHFSLIKEAQFVIESPIAPIPVLRTASPGFGFVGLPLDRDGVVRRVAPMKLYHDQVFRSFGLVVLERASPAPLVMTPLGMRQGTDGPMIPSDRDNTFLINYVGPPRTFRQISYHKVLRGDVPPDTFRDKIVLVGAVSSTLMDSFVTPFFSPLYSNELMAGVEVHANAIDTALTGRYLTRAAPWINVAILLALGGAVGTAAAALRARWGIILCATLALAYAACVIGLFLTKGYWLNLVAPAATIPLALACTGIYRFVREERLKAVARRSLERYVSVEVAREILERGDEVELGGIRRRITVAFCDIRGFTTLSEQSSPEEVVDLLNRFFTRISGPILSHGGTLDKYIGDAIMAFWGAPVARQDDPIRAVRCALDMLRETAAFSAGIEAQGKAPLSVGIGINTGWAIVGNIGSPERMGYTAIGDTVNIASRLQGLTKEYQAGLLISHTTFEEINDLFETEWIGLVTVKGRAEPVGIYKVLGERAPARQASETTLYCADHE
jgi:adenylate cyclase